MSISASVLIVVVIIIRVLLIHRLPKRMFTYLWAVVTLRLVVPFYISVPISIAETEKQNEFTQIVLPAFKQIAHSGEMFEAVTPKAVPILFVVWLFGAVLLAVFFILAYLIAKRRYRLISSVQNKRALEVIKASGIKRKINLMVCNSVSAPLTYGIFRPVILCPENMFDCENFKLEYALLHEIYHIKYFDVLFKLVMTAAVCVHWFNPLVWIMYAFANRDIELACDEAVIKKCPEAIKDYALTLISIKEKQSFTPMLSGLCKNSVTERVEAIMKRKNISLAGTVAAVCISLFALAGCASNLELNVKSDLPTPKPTTTVQNSDDVKSLEDLEAKTDNLNEDMKATEIKIKSALEIKDVVIGEQAVKDFESLFKDKEYAFPLDEKYKATFESYGLFGVNAKQGETIYSITSGEVLQTGYCGGYGNAVIIRNVNGDVFLYGHCDKEFNVGAGDTVTMGEAIAKVGTSGNTTTSRLVVCKIET